VIVDPNIDTQAKRDEAARQEQDHAKEVQDKQTSKLNSHSQNRK